MSTVLPSAKEYADENASTDGGRRFAPAATILLKVELVDGASDEDDGNAILPDEGFDCITISTMVEAGLNHAFYHFLHHELLVRVEVAHFRHASDERLAGFA